MAVLNLLQGISVTIVSKGEVLTEYPDTDHPPDKHASDLVTRHLKAHTVSNYIEAVDAAGYLPFLSQKEIGDKTHN